MAHPNPQLVTPIAAYFPDDLFNPIKGPAYIVTHTEEVVFGSFQQFICNCPYSYPRYLQRCDIVPTKSINNSMKDATVD